MPVFLIDFLSARSTKRCPPHLDLDHENRGEDRQEHRDVQKAHVIRDDEVAHGPVAAVLAADADPHHEGEHLAPKADRPWVPALVPADQLRDPDQEPVDEQRQDQDDHASKHDQR
jgi:hypothetical protein